MQYVIIPNQYRGAVSDPRDHSVFWEASETIALKGTYEASIVQFDPYHPDRDMRRWGRVMVVRYGISPNQTWEITVRRWAPGTNRDLDKTAWDMFSPNYDWPEASFMVMVGKMIGKLEDVL